MSNRVSAIHALGMSLCLAVCFLLLPAYADEPGPAQVVLSILDEAKRSGQNDSAKAISSLIEKHLAVDLVASRILRKKWQELSPEEKTAFTDGLKKLLALQVAKKFRDYSESTTLLEEEKIKGRLADVKWKVSTSQKVSSVVYTLVRQQECWHIYDINADGASLLRSFMAQLRPTLKREGFSGVMREMNDKIARLQAP